LVNRIRHSSAVSWPDENGAGYEEVGLHATLPTDGRSLGP
jgi:hypothetical protein